MTEKELIKNLRQLRKVRPSKDWVITTKQDILGETQTPRLFPFFNPAFAALLLLLIFLGTLEIAKDALPGSPLYPLKKTAQTVSLFFLPPQEKAKASLILAEKRLEELEKISKENLTQNLPPAFKEYTQTKGEAKKEIAKVLPQAKEPEKKEFISKIGQIHEKEKQVFATLQISPKELSETKTQDKELVLTLLKTEKIEDEALLKEIEELCQNENYSLALEKIVIYLSQNQNLDKTNP